MGRRETALGKAALKAAFSEIASTVAMTTALVSSSRVIGACAPSHSAFRPAASGRVSAATSDTAVVRMYASSFLPLESSRIPATVIMPQTTRKTTPTIGRGMTTSSAPTLGERP